MPLHRFTPEFGLESELKVDHDWLIQREDGVSLQRWLGSESKEPVVQVKAIGYFDFTPTLVGV
jgi:hypothetical protein